MTEDPTRSLPKVAFVIPVRNESANIDEVLDTIFAQTGIEPEIIVVDNGSTDDTVARASRRGARTISCSGRVSDCRTAGAAATDARFIFFVDADQRLAPETTERSLRALTDAAVTAVVVPERPYKPRTWLERLTGVERELFEASGRGIPRLFRRSRYLEIGGHPAGVPFGEDYALLSKLKADEIGVADAVIYHCEVRDLGTLLRKYFAYGRQMAAAPPSESIFSKHRGRFLAQAGRYALHTPSAALGVVGLKALKLTALRLGAASAASRPKQPRESTPPTEGQWLLVALLAPLLCIVMNWRMLTTSGIFLMGDHVTPRADYWRQILGAWIASEHGGTANPNLIDSPYFVLLGVLERIAGVGAGDRVLILLSFSVAILSATILLVRVLRVQITVAFVLGVLYAFNPWTAARLASGHTELLMAYGLLPLFVLIWQKPSNRSLLIAGIGLAVVMCLSLPMALLAVVALIVLGGARGQLRWRLRDVGISFALAIGMSLWWILPLLSTHGGSTGHTGLANIFSYTQLADIVHAVTLRSYWWPALSDGLYHYDNFIANTLVGFGMLVIVAAEVAMLVCWRRLSPLGRAAAATWVAVLVILVFAHTFPVAYWMVLHLPLVTLYRDPDKLVALSLLGFIVAFGDLAGQVNWRRSALIVACSAVACVTAPWWSSGDLRGWVRPQVIRDGSLAAAGWISKQGSSGLVLWWPDGPYVRYRWYSAGGQDPLRYWSQNPMLNPYYDPAYDASPETTNFLYALIGGISNGNVPYLGGLLSTYGIRYIAVRNYVSTSFTDFPNYRSDFAAIRDLRRVRTFGDTDVYENLAWRPGADTIGHYVAMLTGTPTTILPLDPQLGADDVFYTDGAPWEASYEYLDIDRQLERAIATYRYELATPYDVIYPAQLPPERGPLTFRPTCSNCDVLLLRTNAVAPRISVSGMGRNPVLLYEDLPSWEPRWRAYAVGSSRKLTIASGDSNAYIYEAAMVSGSALDTARRKSFDEVRHHWPTYLASAADLDMRPYGAIIRSDRMGPMVETDSRKWRAIVVGRGLSSATLTFYWWNGGARQKVLRLACTSLLCTGAVQLAPGFQRVVLAANRGETIQGLSFSSGRPPAFDNSRVDQIPARMDAATKVFVPISYTPGWFLACAGGTVSAEVGNEWATLYPPRRRVTGCVQRYWPESMKIVGTILSLLVLIVVVIALILIERLPAARSVLYDRENVFETTG